MLKPVFTLRKLLPVLLVLALLALPALATGNDPVIIGCEEQYALDPGQLPQARASVWNDYCLNALSDPVLQEETQASAITFGDATMRYSVSVIGDKPQNGYPLYIAMHGGGSSDTPDANDEQWEIMQSYYSDNLDCGVYVAVRGVRDTWDTHFNPESYPLYDRLIRYMILTEDIDPNRVYLMGFSAGGDGVYAVGTRMADCFAAANMSSGHPNGVSVLNLYNLPIQLQAGEFDEAYDRNNVTADYGMELDALQQHFGGFVHRTLIHYDCGHNYDDFGTDPLPVMSDPAQWRLSGDRSSEYVDSYPPDYMNDFVRDPLPPRVIWDLSTRANSREIESFYYLSAPYSTDSGTLIAEIDDTENAVRIEVTDLNGPFSLLLNEDIVDFSRPVLLEIDGMTYDLSITPDLSVLVETTFNRGDPNYQFEAEIHFDAEGNLVL